MNNFKKDFAVFDNNTDLVYLDSAASSLKPKCVVDSMTKYYNEYGVNVNRGIYKLSYLATEKYESSRAVIAEFIGAKEKEVVFTRGCSSALNLVASSYGMMNINEGDEIITSELEHHSNMIPWQNVCKIKKAKLVSIPLTKEGMITVDAFKKVLSNKTKIVAITHVSNVMGYITPIKEIIKLAHEVGAIVVLDGAQSAPHMSIDVKELDCDFFALSGHKMCGPTGIGILYGKYNLLESMDPIEFGGDMADLVSMKETTYKCAPFKFETGTPLIAEVIGLAEACKYLKNVGFDFIVKKEEELRNLAISKLNKIKGITIFNEKAPTGIITFNVDDVHPHDAASVFDQNNVCIRAGHHCAQPITAFLGQISTLRASFYFYNDEKDVEKFIESVQEAVDFFGQF